MTDFFSERSLLDQLLEQYEILLGNYQLQPDNHSDRALKDFLSRYPTMPKLAERLKEKQR
jgi:hypothetical protein